MNRRAHEAVKNWKKAASTVQSSVHNTTLQMPPYRAKQPVTALSETQTDKDLHKTLPLAREGRSREITEPKIAAEVRKLRNGERK